MCVERHHARKGRSRQPVPETLPDDLFDYADEPTSGNRKRRRSPLHVFDVERLPVIDDWPRRVPVTQAEIDIFERYFGDVLDRLFGPVDAGPGNDDLLNLTPDGNNNP